MSEREAWYAKLAAHPDDSGLRMIVADRLDDRGAHGLADVIRYIISPPRWGRKTLNALLAKQTGNLARYVHLVPWREPAFTQLSRPPDQLLDVLTIRNSSSGVIWYRGFMADVHCSGDPLSLKLVPLSKRMPLVEGRLSNGSRKRLADRIADHTVPATARSGPTASTPAPSAPSSSG